MFENVYILLGSNMGDRIGILETALGLILERCGEIVKKSPVYESEPWGFEAQQWFLNQVVIVKTALKPRQVMQALLDIEAELGRDRSQPHKGYSSRPIDLDVVYFGSQVLDDPFITVPHPRLHLRKFVLLPLNDVAPDFIHPVMNATNKSLLENCPDNLKVRMLYKHSDDC